MNKRSKLTINLIRNKEARWTKTGKIFFSFLLFLLTSLFTLASQKASAEETTPTVSVTCKFSDTITIVNVTNNEGGDLN